MWPCHQLPCVGWVSLAQSLRGSSPILSLAEGVEPNSVNGLDPTVCAWAWGERGELFVLIHCLNVRASHSGSFLSNPPSSAINSPGQILPSVSDFGYINCANQTDSFQFRRGQNSHLHKQQVAYVTRAQYTSSEKSAQSFRCLRCTQQTDSTALASWLRQHPVQAAFFTPRSRSFPQPLFRLKAPIVRCTLYPIQSLTLYRGWI